MYVHLLHDSTVDWRKAARMTVGIPRRCIFDFYMGQFWIHEWCTLRLVHVCRKWRVVVFGYHVA
jgi:hypothetical protein